MTLKDAIAHGRMAIETLPEIQRVMFIPHDVEEPPAETQEESTLVVRCTDVQRDASWPLLFRQNRENDSLRELNEHSLLDALLMIEGDFYEVR